MEYPGDKDDPDSIIIDDLDEPSDSDISVHTNYLPFPRDNNLDNTLIEDSDSDNQVIQKVTGNRHDPWSDTYADAHSEVNIEG